MLPEVELPLQIQLKVEEEMKRFQLNKLNLVGQSRITDIHDFIANRTNLRPREATRIVEILFNQRARNDLISVRNQFYDRRQPLEDLGLFSILTFNLVYCCDHCSRRWSMYGSRILPSSIPQPKGTYVEH